MCNSVILSAAKYDAERDAREIKDRKDRQLKKIEEARKKSKEPKGIIMLNFVQNMHSTSRAGHDALAEKGFTQFTLCTCNLRSNLSQNSTALSQACVSSNSTPKLLESLNLNVSDSIFGYNYVKLIQFNDANC